jgi:putative hydrolase of the HAD superfamily
VTNPIRLPDSLGAVILDMGGVVRHWRPGPASAVEEAFRLPSGTIGSVAMAVPEYQLGVLGLCTFADWLDAIARELSIRIGIKAREAVARWAEDRGEIDRDTMAIVERLRSRVPVHVLSNAPDCFLDDMRQLGLSEAFDGFHYSAEMGLAKPDPAAYLKALERIDMPANRCVFVDDRMENVVAAQSVGILAFAYTTPAAFADEMSRLSIKTEHRDAPPGPR